MSNMKSLDRSSLIMILVLSLMMLGTCVICWHFKVHQKIGAPAFRIVPGELMNEKNEVVRTNIIDLPVEVGAFTSKPMIVSNHELNWLPDDTLYGRRRYTCTTNGFFGDLSIVLMEKDRTSIHKPQYCLPAGGFIITKEETVELPVRLEDGTYLKSRLIHAARDIKTNTGEIQKLNAAFFYYYATDGPTTPDHIDMMWRMSKGLLTSGTTQRWGYVSFLAWFYPEDEAAAIEECKKFLGQAIPLFQSPVRYH